MWVDDTSVLAIRLLTLKHLSKATPQPKRHTIVELLDDALFQCADRRLD